MSKKIGLKEAMSIGIGGMVGGGIFAVLGLAVSMAQGGTPIAFLFAGIIALITSYSYVKLSTKYPDRGGLLNSSINDLENQFLEAQLIIFYG